MSYEKVGVREVTFEILVKVRKFYLDSSFQSIVHGKYEKWSITKLSRRNTHSLHLSSYICLEFGGMFFTLIEVVMHEIP